MQNEIKDFDTTSLLQIMFNKHKVTVKAKWAQFFFHAKSLRYTAQTLKGNLNVPKNKSMIRR